MRSLWKVLLLLAISATASASSWSVSLTPNGVSTALLDQRWGSSTLDAALGVDRGAFSVGAYWRAAQLASLLGNLVVELRVGHDASGTRLGAALRGVLGPVAVRLDLGIGNRASGSLWPLLEAGGVPLPPSPPPAAGWGSDATLAANWRLNRSWSFAVNPQLRVHDGVWQAAIATSVRRSAILPDIDISVHNVLQRLAGASTSELLFGLSLHHVPRRAPASEAGLWLAAERWGGYARVMQRTPAGLWQLHGSWGASPLGTPSDYLGVAFERPWGDGQLTLGAGWGSQGVLARVGYRAPRGD